MKKFIYFEHTADIEFEAYGETLKEAFENACLALENCIVDLNQVKVKKEVKRTIKGIDLKELLYNLLEECILLFEINNFLFSKVEIKEFGENEIKVSFFGEELKNHELKYEIKAITYFNMQIGKKKVNGKTLYYCHAVLDI